MIFVVIKNIIENIYNQDSLRNYYKEILRKTSRFWILILYKYYIK